MLNSFFDGSKKIKRQLTDFCVCAVRLKRRCPKTWDYLSGKPTLKKQLRLKQVPETPRHLARTTEILSGRLHIHVSDSASWRSLFFSCSLLHRESRHRHRHRRSSCSRIFFINLPQMPFSFPTLRQINIVTAI